MITSFDKAIAAALGFFLWLLSQYAGINLGLSPEAFNGIVAALVPLLVWLVPNKTA
jgi:hypothetical protein